MDINSKLHDSSLAGNSYHEWITEDQTSTANSRDWIHPALKNHSVCNNSQNGSSWTPFYTIGKGVERAALVQPYQKQPGDPAYRPLRIYTLDPAASRNHGAEATVQIPYEKLAAGPIGALIQVVCEDQHEKHNTEPINLDDPNVLIHNGCKPSPINLQFHQQMVYAVSMMTYTAFRSALGRDIAWGFTNPESQSTQPKLRIYPYSSERSNAYYDANNGALHFGYYTANEVVHGRNLPKGRVYTSLSHDIIVHEMTHALLDGLRSRFTRPTNADVPAFHEGFADLIAIFQRFSHPEVVKAVIRNGHRNWGGEVPLFTSIARQFGETTNVDGQLRVNINMDSVQRNPIMYAEAGDDPHELGGVLVAAVLNAVLTIFLRKTRRYFRLATSGTGILPQGELSHELHEMLATDAQRLARQFLSICVRAIDYCPPVDIEFGDFLRAVITADHDLVPDDPWRYREAWIDAFRVRGIYPNNVHTLAEDALKWRAPSKQIPSIKELSFSELRFKGEPSRPATKHELCRQARELGKVISRPEWIEEFGCASANDPRLQGDMVDPPSIESIRTAQRVGPNGHIVYDLVAEVLQRRRVQKSETHPAFDFYGGATVIIDPDGNIRYVIHKRIVSETRLRRSREFMSSKNGRNHWIAGKEKWRLKQNLAHGYPNGR